MELSEPKLISPLLDNFTMGGSFSDRHGISCCPAIKQDTDMRYIVKIISIPASQVQLDALLLTGAYHSSDDALRYFKEDPLYRKFRHNSLTFSMTYAFSENFILPLSHDEVVHGKCSLVNKMPGDYQWKFSNLRLLQGYQMAHPGKKLTFMGSEFGQFIEWNFKQGLDWLLLDYEQHVKAQAFTRDLNRFYLENDQLWADDLSWDGFQWIEPDDGDNSILAFRRIDKKKRELIVVCNFTPVTRDSFRLGLPKAGTYVPVLCSDDTKYGGFGIQPTEVVSEHSPFKHYQDSGLFRIPPMSITFYTRRPGRPAGSGEKK